MLELRHCIDRQGCAHYCAVDCWREGCVAEATVRSLDHAAALSPFKGATGVARLFLTDHAAAVRDHAAMQPTECRDIAGLEPSGIPMLDAIRLYSLLLPVGQLRRHLLELQPSAAPLKAADIALQTCVGSDHGSMIAVLLAVVAAQRRSLKREM